MTVTVTIAALVIAGLILLALVKGTRKSKKSDPSLHDDSNDESSVIPWEWEPVSPSEPVNVVIEEPVFESPKVKEPIVTEKKAPKKLAEKPKVKDKPKTKAEPKSKKEVKKESKPTKKFEKKIDKKKSPKKPGKGDKLLLS
jgi:septal ring-binding cell division protein DamX